MQDAINGLPEEPVDQAELLDDQGEVIPVLRALSEKSDNALDSIGPDSITGVVEGTI